MVGVHLIERINALTIAGDYNLAELMRAYGCGRKWFSEELGISFS
jgi:hypothetical protein